MSNTRKEKIEALLTELVKVGTAYPERPTKGFFGLFAHRNQRMANKLMRLGDFKDKSEAEIRTELEGIYNMFTGTNSSLLRKIHNRVVESGLFADVNKATEDINSIINWADAHNDGGGRSIGWNVESYKSTIIGRNPGSVEMRSLAKK